MIRSTAAKVVIIPLYATSLMVWAPRANADEYQDQIARAFVGFEILNRSDFTEEIQKAIRTNPALATGHFNRDKLEDFAAIILNRSTQYGQQGEKKYYLGKYVVCHGTEKGLYQCQTLREEHVYLPYERYLRRMRPGKLKCVVGKELKVTNITLEHDGIARILIDRDATVYVNQSDGTYRECDQPFD